MIKKDKIKSIILNMLLCLITFFILIIFLEILLRTTHLFGARLAWSKPDPILCRRFVPNSTYWFNRENNHPITGKINSYGWRDKEWSIKKPSHVFRIAVLGDSYVESFQVELESTFLKLAEHELNTRLSNKVELMNFGRSGFTQTEELLILQSDVKQFNPDMVIVCFLPGNDIDDVRKETAPHFNRPFYKISEGGEFIIDTSFRETQEFRVRSFVNYFQRKSALLSLLYERYNAYTQNLSAHKKALKMKRRTPPDKIGGYMSLCTNSPDPKYLGSYRLNKILIKAMAEYCKKNSIRFMLICLNTDSYIPEVEESYKNIDSTFNTNFFEDNLRDYANLLDIEYIGLQRIFRQFYKSNGDKLHWGHWNYCGHKLVGDTISNKLYSILNQPDKK